MRVTLFGLVSGAALLAIAAAPTVWAKDSGSYAVQCLSNDTALQQAEGISGPSGPVTVTIQPASLWPPNHKMRTEQVTANLTSPFNSTPPASPYADGANITVWLTDITDNQVTDDNLGGHGCGAPTAKQGPDWLPAVTMSDPTSYDTASATLTDTNPVPLDFSDQGTSPEPVSVKVRGERCSRGGVRTYVLSIVCCDTTGGSGNAVCDDQYIQAVENSQSTTLTQASTTESLEVTVPKSQGRHH